MSTMAKGAGKEGPAETAGPRMGTPTPFGPIVFDERGRTDKRNVKFALCTLPFFYAISGPHLTLCFLSFFDV